MAESCNRAFGRYLKLLRERRGLSLVDVESLSQPFADPIQKGYLSRCENGHQRLALSKLIPLCRVYDIPSGVLVERMELDLELDRIGGPDTEGLGFEALFGMGREAIDSGDFWRAYGAMRDSIQRSTIDPLSFDFRDLGEQEVRAYAGCATVACALDRYEFALNEYKHARSMNAASPRFAPVLTERLSVCYRGLGEIHKAAELADKSLQEAREVGDPWTLGYIYGTLGNQAAEESNLDLAASHYREAFKFQTESNGHLERARTLGNLARVYFSQSRIGAAKKTLEVADRLCVDGNHQRTRAIVKIVAGEIEAHEGRLDGAEARFKEAAAIGRVLNDRAVSFRADFHLMKLAREQGNKPVERAIRRRLSRLSAWVPAATPELLEFKQLTN